MRGLDFIAAFLMIAVSGMALWFSYGEMTWAEMLRKAGERCPDAPPEVVEAVARSLWQDDPAHPEWRPYGKEHLKMLVERIKR